jgi:hypothetical protein
MASGHQIRMGKFRLVFLDDPDDGVAAVAGLHVDNTPRLADVCCRSMYLASLASVGRLFSPGFWCISLTEPAQIAWVPPPW